MPVADEDKDITTFPRHVGTYRFNRMPFGLMKAPKLFNERWTLSLTSTPGISAQFT